MYGSDYDNYGGMIVRSSCIFARRLLLVSRTSEFFVERLQPHPPRRVGGVDWRDMVSVNDGLRPCLIEERGFYGKQFGWGKYYFDKRVVLLRNPSCYNIA